jgi:hypothetical protein
MITYFGKPVIINQTSQGNYGFTRDNKKTINRISFFVIATGFLDFVHRPEFYKQENTTFRKLDLFPSSGEGGGTYSFRNLRKSLP